MMVVIGVGHNGGCLRWWSLELVIVVVAEGGSLGGCQVGNNGGLLADGVGDLVVTEVRKGGGRQSWSRWLS